MRYTGPKARKCRRQGINLYGSDKYDKILQRKPHGPGKSPKLSGGRGAKLSEYGRQLLEKQKVSAIYGVHDRQLSGIFLDAANRTGQTDRIMNSTLERRLDSALYRAGFANTRLQSRQFVSHGLFLVNGKRVTIPSYELKVGDKVSVRTQAKNSPAFPAILEAHGRYTPPDWLKVDTSNLSFEVINIPTDDKHFEQAVDMRKVVGFYSR